MFEIEPGEDEKTNPGIYGKQLASWIREKMASKGYPAEEVIPEDWGWCVMCSREPFLLWIGCSIMQDAEEDPREMNLKSEDIIWHCFVAAEVSFWQTIFSKVDTKPAEDKLSFDLESILKAEKQITFVEEP